MFYKNIQKERNNMNISRRLPLVDKITYLKIKRIMDISNGMLNISEIIKTKGMYADEFARTTASKFEFCGHYLQTTIGTSTFMIPTLGNEVSLIGTIETLTELLRPISYDIKTNTKKIFPKPDIIRIAAEITNGFEKNKAKKSQESIKTFQKSIEQAINDPEYREAMLMLENIFIK
jgi:hypothetical protein